MKKTLKTLLVIMLAFTVLFCLAGCGNKEEEEKKELSMGKWEDGVYENSFLKYKFELPEGWTASTDKEIASQMKLGEDVLANEGKYISEASKLSAVYFAAAKEATGNNILIMAEKTGANATLDQYMSALKSQLTSLTELNYEVTDEGTEKLGNAECSTITLKENQYGIAQKSYVYKEGDYFVLVTMTSVEGEDLFDELKNNFKAN